MLSYQHGYHAGNKADCLKHAVLHAVLETYAKNPTSLFYVETHAARGLYDLKSDQARKTGEAKTGILAIEKRADLPAAIKPWVNSIKPKLSKAYPGSPALAARILPPSARLVLFEKHPTEHKALLGNLGTDDRIQIKKDDGYRGALRLQPRRGEDMLVTLDPSYETEADMEVLANWVPRAMRRWPRAAFLIWLPLFADGREEGFGAYLSDLGEGFVAGSRWPRPDADPSSLTGSAMIGLGIKGAAAKRAFSIAAGFDQIWRNSA